MTRLRTETNLAALQQLAAALQPTLSDPASMTLADLKKLGACRGGTEAARQLAQTLHPGTPPEDVRFGLAELLLASGSHASWLLDQLRGADRTSMRRLMNAVARVLALAVDPTDPALDNDLAPILKRLHSARPPGRLALSRAAHEAYPTVLWPQDKLLEILMDGEYVDIEDFSVTARCVCRDFFGLERPEAATLLYHLALRVTGRPLPVVRTPVAVGEELLIDGVAYRVALTGKRPRLVLAA